MWLVVVRTDHFIYVLTKEQVAVPEHVFIAWWAWCDLDLTRGRVDRFCNDCIVGMKLSCMSIEIESNRVLLQYSLKLHDIGLCIDFADYATVFSGLTDIRHN